MYMHTMYKQDVYEYTQSKIYMIGLNKHMFICVFIYMYTYSFWYMCICIVGLKICTHIWGMQCGR